nr:MAG TPA: hypothetical protein [Caudoviricetes sp.]
MRGYFSYIFTFHLSLITVFCSLPFDMIIISYLAA